MAEDTSKGSAGNTEGSATPSSVSVGEIKEPINFTNPEEFRSGVDLLASSQPGTQSELLKDRFMEVHVRLPSYGYDGSTSTTMSQDIETRSEVMDVFFDTKNGYLVAFRSNSKTVFALKDTSSGSPDYVKLLEQAWKSKVPVRSRNSKRLKMLGKL